MVRSDDGAESWDEMHKGGQKSGIPWSVANPTTGESVTFDSSIRELAIHPTDPNVVVAGTGLCSAIYSKDGGRNWVELGCALPATIADDGLISVTYPDGRAASNTKPYPLFGGGDGWASDVRFHPDDPSRVYFSNTYGIFTRKLPE